MGEKSLPDVLPGLPCRAFWGVFLPRVKPPESSLRVLALAPGWTWTLPSTVQRPSSSSNVPSLSETRMWDVGHASRCHAARGLQD